MGKKTRFFVRPLESKRAFQNIAEVNIMMNENNSRINLYAQLPIAAENRASECRPSFSAGAVLDQSWLRAVRKFLCFFSTDSRIYLGTPKWVQKFTEVSNFTETQTSSPSTLFRGFLPLPNLDPLDNKGGKNLRVGKKSKNTPKKFSRRLRRRDPPNNKGGGT